MPRQNVPVVFEEGTSNEGDFEKRGRRSGDPHVWRFEESPTAEGSQRRASFTSQTQPIYNVIETTMAGQKPRRGTPTIMAMT